MTCSTGGNDDKQHSIGGRPSSINVEAAQVQTGDVSRYRGRGNDRCEALKLNRVTRTPKVKGHYQEQERVYLIDGDDREFSSIEEAIAALEEKGILT